MSAQATTNSVPVTSDASASAGAAAPLVADAYESVTFPPPVLGAPPPPIVVSSQEQSGANQPPTTPPLADQSGQAQPVGQSPTGQQPPTATSGGLTPSGSTHQTSTAQATGMTPTFIDTFSGSSIDQSKWGFNYPWSDTCDTNGNAMEPTEYAAYASPNCNGQPNPFTTGSNGLGISIKSGDLAGKPAVTGQIYSKQAQLYGYFEMTAKLPSTTGVGGAFWLLPQDGSWPPELDVMEELGQDPNTIYQTVHGGTSANPGNDQGSVNVAGGSQNGFHTYGVDWEPNTITYYVDGVATRTTATPASMHKPMYMIVSMNSSPPGNTIWGSPIDTSKAVNDNYQIKDVVAYANNPYTAQ